MKKRKRFSRTMSNKQKCFSEEKQYRQFFLSLNGEARKAENIMFKPYISYLKTRGKYRFSKQKKKLIDKKRSLLNLAIEKMNV